ncbi:MAG TPA: ATP-binding protein [Ilumatobacteraceae bacterium]|nr:ATP-binding protein [Ilumatobacteraceae bacterium]
MTSRTFLGELACVAAARRFVRDTLQGEGQDAACDAAVLMVSELATNVVLHAGTSFEIVLDVSNGLIRVEIHDGMAVSHAFRDLIENPPTVVEPVAAGGRGIMLIGLTALRFGLQDNGPEGKAVWFELPAVVS